MKRFLRFFTVLIPACACLTAAACKRDAKAEPAPQEDPMQTAPAEDDNLPVPLPEPPVQPEECPGGECPGERTAPPGRSFYPLPYIPHDGHVRYIFPTRSLPFIIIIERMQDPADGEDAVTPIERGNA